MHRFLRAIGFSKITKREELQELINTVVTKSFVHMEKNAKKDFVADENDRVSAELFYDFSEDIGVCVRGEIDEENRFCYEYYFPYLRSHHISSYEDITIERHAEKESYAGICDDIKIGVSIIFYLQEMIPYLKLKYANRLPVKGTSLSLSALSVDGTIMMPIIKNEKEKKKIKKVSSERNQLLAQARMGDEDAIESLTLDDMDTYTSISKKIHKTDVYTLVDTYFMPYGVECDQYSILGEILEVREQTNSLTKEEVYILTIECNEMTFEVAINKEDLLGEPMVGRRFKGVIWLQGNVNFPNYSEPMSHEEC